MNLKWNLGIVYFFFVNFALSSQVEQGNLLSNWKDDSLAGSAQYGNTYNEIWGLAVNGSEYAIIGSTEGTHFVNVSDPSNPVEDFFVQGSSYGPHIVHRDYHDYKGYLYIVADEDIGTLKSRMQIVDISNLPESLEVVYDSDDRIRKAHNIFIDTSQARLYGFAIKGGDDPYAPMRIYDISDPLEPVQLGEYRFGLDGVSVGHYHDGFIRDNIAYLNAGGDGLVIADLTDPENPKLLSHLTASDYPDSGYNHSGWLSEDGNYYYMGDETWGTAMKVFDVSDPSNVRLVTTFDAENDSQFSITHNQIVHCNFLFTSYYYDGLQVFNIEDPENPKRVLHYPTSNFSPQQNYQGAWGVFPFLPSGNILVSDMQNGLFVIENFTNYCAATSSTSNLDQEISDIEISPNPSQGDFLISAKTEIKSIQVYNIAASLVSKIDNVNKTQTEVSIQKPGIYFASIYTGNSHQTKKIIVQD